MKKTALVVVVVSTLALGGCIHHQTTVYKDVDRVKVEFENDSAARIFYETFTKHPHHQRKEESKTEIHLPIVFGHSHRVVSGNNMHFNEAVLSCDTNQDG